MCRNNSNTRLQQISSYLKMKLLTNYSLKNHMNIHLNKQITDVEL